MESIIVAAVTGGLALIGTLTGTYFANRKSSALIAYRLEELEKKATEAARSFDKALAETYAVTAGSGLHIRNGAGTGKASLAVLPNGTRVRNYGYYTLTGGVK